MIITRKITIIVTKIMMVAIFLTMMIWLGKKERTRWDGEGCEGVNPICALFSNKYVFYVYFIFIIFFLYIFL